MLKAGLISFALCTALFSAVSNCATFSKETQAKLRDVQADNFEDNSVAIALDDNIEERVGKDENEDESDAEEEDSQDEDGDEPESEIAEIKDDTTELEENDFLESEDPWRRWRRVSRRRGRRDRNRPRRRRRRRGGRRHGGRRRGGLQQCPPGTFRCGTRCFDLVRFRCCRVGGRLVGVPRFLPCS